MNALPRWRVALLCALAFGGVARAEPPKPAVPAPASPAAAPAPSLAPKPAAAPAPASPAAQQPPPAAPAAASGQKPAPQAAAPGGMSESKYLSLLYAEIAKHTPEENTAGPGEVVASFIIGPSGRITKVTIDKTSSPTHADVVKKILSEVVTPPPPGGSLDVGQTFKFR
ncbi:energy transducer TonB [Methylocystis echinoides]|uniref:energy transducer TonB n=1 Tax=Methylocystis echinoides TaxID=29468 RepID=UPI00343C89F8